MSSLPDVGDIHLSLVVGIKVVLLHGDGGQHHFLDVPVHQQVADLAVGADAGFLTAGLQIGVVGGVGQICGGLVLFFTEEGVVVVQILAQLVADAKLPPFTCCISFLFFCQYSDQRLMLKPLVSRQ